MQIELHLPRLLREAGIADERQAEKLADLIAEQMVTTSETAYGPATIETVRPLIKS